MAPSTLRGAPGSSILRPSWPRLGAAWGQTSRRLGPARSSTPPGPPLTIPSRPDRSAKISLAGSLTRGLAAVIINQTEVTDIFAASASGTSRFTIQNTGNLLATGTITGLTGITSSVNFWARASGALTPLNPTDDVNLGSAATASAKISLAGSLTRGLAAVIINQTEVTDIFE